MTQNDRAVLFRSLHDRRPLVLPNAWDAGSARLLEQTGAAAIGTTSAGVSWARGRRDGQTLPREMMIEELRRMVAAVAVPVTADIESGYGAGTANDVAETVRGVIQAGAVGINLEDTPGRAGEPLLTAEEHGERISAARQVATTEGHDLFINARIDVYLTEWGHPEARLDETARRANCYLAAGADGVFVPGVADVDTVSRLVQMVDGPVNIMASPGCSPILELGRIGVARVSVGPGLAQAALAAALTATAELLEHGTYAALDCGLAFAEADALFDVGP
jgi:2-methylisocitrate lyase-like PEP mutase family enzyme